MKFFRKLKLVNLIGLILLLKEINHLTIPICLRIIDDSYLLLTHFPLNNQPLLKKKKTIQLKK